MKKALIFVIFLSLIGSVLFFRGDLFQAEQAAPQPPEEKPTTQGIFGVQTQNEEETKSLPTTAPSRLTISKLGVSAAVESVGMNEKGEMAVPQEDMNVAWYNLGFKPGENGSAVIAGHFDTRTGAPAVFYNLDDLVNGDEVTVTYPDGTAYTFVVTDSTLYPYDDFPLQKVFNSTGTPTLNLITCDGVFNTQVRSYTERLVVHAVLKDEL